MKKTILTITTIITTTFIFGQLKVNPNGCIGMGFNNPGGTYKLEVKGDLLLSDYPANSYNELTFKVGNGWPGTEIGSNKDVIGFWRSWVGYHKVWAEQYFTSSDRKLKSNIKEIDNGLEKIKKLNAYIYDIEDNQFGENQEKIKGSRKSFGFIAQEVEELFPEVTITQDGKEGIKSMDYSQIIPIAISAIKEQQKEIENLKEEIKSIKSSSVDNNLQNEAELNQLFQNKPNPFNLETIIEFKVDNNEFKSGNILLFNMSGTLILTKEINSNQEKVVVSGENLKPGMYIGFAEKLLKSLFLLGFSLVLGV